MAVDPNRKRGPQRRSAARDAKAPPLARGPEPDPHIEANLDEALEETFPASDPISIFDGRT